MRSAEHYEWTPEDLDNRSREHVVADPRHSSLDRIDEILSTIDEVTEES